MLQKELATLKKYIGKDDDKFDKHLAIIKEKYKSEKDIAQIDKFIRDGLNELTQDLMEFNEDLTVKEKLRNVSEIVSLSYIAQTYFGKKRHWLYQKINGNIVNGKAATFDEKELEKLDFALQDISKKIGSVSVSR
ncbi:MAG: DUF5053 domain-containing protein [Chitinophagaceae bacterium]